MWKTCLPLSPQFYPKNPDSVHGVVYMGSGNRISDAMQGAEVPALVLRGSRDPFCPEEVSPGLRCIILLAFLFAIR